jgi:hypothetical protein
LDREALAVIFALKKFEKYLLGQDFVIHTDHKPLESLFNLKKGLPSVATTRLHRWMGIVSLFNCTVIYKKGSRMQNADALSRLPLDRATGLEEFAMNTLDMEQNLPVTMEKIAVATKNDPMLARIYDFSMSGWTKDVPRDLKKYFDIRLDLSCDQGCLFYEHRVVIPEGLKHEILKKLHEGHIGIVRMKLLARSYVWWFGLSRDLDDFGKSCNICTSNQKKIKDCPNSYWPMTTKPMERVHIDLFHYNDLIFLIIVDSFSKWIDVQLLTKPDAVQVIRALKIFFANFGLCLKLVSDNGPPFKSRQFQAFAEANGIVLLNSPEYHPESNGLAERAVQTIKRGLTKYLTVSKNINEIKSQILNFLFIYRNTPTVVTGKSPSELIFGYRPGTLLGLLNGNRKEISKETGKEMDAEWERKKMVMQAEKAQVKKRLLFSSKKREELEFEEGQKVLYFLSYRNFNKWLPARVVKKLSSLVYLVEVEGRNRRAMRNQLRRVHVSARFGHYPTGPAPLSKKRVASPIILLRSKKTRYNLRNSPKKRYRLVKVPSTV